jgi:hypothetical protein
MHYVDEGGRCGIWRDRQSVCATWFCKHERGAVGWDFWNRGVRELLTVAEAALARLCVLELDVGPEALDRLFPTTGPGAERESEDSGQLDGVDELTYRARWGRWAGREREFYARCAALVDAMDWGAVLAAGGSHLRARAAILAAHYRRLRGAEVPARVRPGTFEVVDVGPENARLVTYSEYDPLSVPTALLGRLHRFDGRPTRQVQRGLANEAGGDGGLDDALLRRLLDYQVLI